MRRLAARVGTLGDYGTNLTDSKYAIKLGFHYAYTVDRLTLMGSYVR